MKKSWLLLVILGCGMTLFAQQKYPPIEKLVYTGYYNWGPLWVKAGRVEFSVTCSDLYPGAQKIEAVGTSLPSWDWMFTLRDTLVSHHDPQTFYPYAFSRMAHEGSYHKTFDYVFHYPDSLVYGDIHRIGRFRRQDTVKLLPDTYDMLSVAWKARELDFDSYRKGELIPIRILIDSKIYDLHIRYQGTDRVKVAGRKRECYVFSPLLVEGDVFKGGENMKVWVSRDEYRLPVMVEAKILVGSVKGILEPAESKIGM
ncbi:MAG: DUF3108 domain-containing protein [Odoribacter sp.]|nr:DUF3108 domain-containing protein [Odoribacter sp.]